MSCSRFIIIISIPGVIVLFSGAITQGDNEIMLAGRRLACCMTMGCHDNGQPAA
jgi:hypothetical protein